MPKSRDNLLMTGFPYVSSVTLQRGPSQERGFEAANNMKRMLSGSLNCIEMLIKCSLLATSTV